MTVANLFAKHRAGEISKDKFLIEVRKDQNLPWISNLTSYDDAIKILKQKGVIKESFLGFGKKKDSYEGPNIDGLAKSVIIIARDRYKKTISHDKAVNLIKKYAGEIESLKGYSNKGYKPSDDTVAAQIIKKAHEKGEILDESKKMSESVSQYTIKKAAKDNDLDSAISDIQYELGVGSPKYANHYFNRIPDIDSNWKHMTIPERVELLTDFAKAQAKNLDEARDHDYEPIYRREPVDAVDDQDDFDSTDYLEFTDGNTTVSLYKDGSRWIEGDIVKGKKPYGWGGKTYMSYLTPKDIAGYLSKDYGGKWSSYEGLEESKSPKKIIKESQEELYLSIDRMNPILVYKAVNTELAKLPEISKEIYQKTLEKVVNRLKKDPTAYDDIIISNAKQMRKEDEKRKMVPVKSELKDPHHQMKSPKGLEKVKSNTKETKTENKKGKPKGVKEMSSHTKGHKGMKQMKQPEKKHKVMESIIESLLEKKINEDTHWRYGINQGVETPDGHGIIKNIMGGTLTVELENGDIHYYQLNVINHIADKGQKSINHISPVSKKEENKTSNSDEKKDAIIKKVVEFLKKKKKKVEEDTLIPTSSNKQALKQKIASNSRLNQNQKNSANTAIDKGDIVNI